MVMGMDQFASEDDEIVRSLYCTHYSRLSIYLDEPLKEPRFWKLMNTLPDPRNETIKIYTADNQTRKSMQMYLESISRQPGKSGSKALIQDYGTKLGTLRHLLRALQEAGLNEAADYVHEEILGRKGQAPRLPEHESDTPAYLAWLAELAQNYHFRSPPPAPVERPLCPADPNPLETQIVDPGTTVYFDYEYLRARTANFNDTPRAEGGAFLGRGGFGGVYYARLGSNQFEVAVKRLGLESRNNTDTCVFKQYTAEFHELAKFNRANILRVVGACGPVDGQAPVSGEVCIVYEYIANGNLKQHLACEDPYGPLAAEERNNIAVGVAKGIHYLHTDLGTPFVHRDIKSANILLRPDLTPVIGDFGTARHASDQRGNVNHTMNIPGTLGYIPPWHRTGHITVHTDIYCYGVILLELLSGRKPFDDESGSLLTYELEGEEVYAVLDARGGAWPPGRAESIWMWAWQCLDNERNQMPSMETILMHPTYGLNRGDLL